MNDGRPLNDNRLGRTLGLVFALASAAGFGVGIVLALAFLVTRPTEKDCSAEAAEDVLIEFGYDEAEAFKAECRYLELTSK